ncbi:GGDEF domain-containing protein [Devosia nitrariae]|nr:diguanylate cyclase [Devosia nitrariae]
MRDPEIMAEAERLLSGRTRDVRLKGRLAEAFRDRSWRQTAKIVRSWMVWVVVLDILTLTINMFLLPRSAALAMLAPGAVIAPAALAVALIWRKQRSDLILSSSLMIGMFIILLAVSLTGIAAGGEWHERYLNVMVFVAIAGITIFSVPQWQTLSIAVMALGLYLLFMLQNPRVEVLSTLSAFLFFASGVSATVVARRTMTILAHKAFLLELRDRRRLAELEEANGQLEELARIDPLTGVANRRWMTQMLDALWNTSEHRSASVAMLMCDIDEFKRLNDRRGHAEGDRCLVEVARIIASRVRRADYVARYGGEEFLVVLPEATERGALEVAERIRKNVEAAAIPNPGSRVAPVVTISIGVAVEPDDAERMTSEQLQSHADMALYFAKRAGRNRAELYKPKLLGLGKRAAPNVA